MENMSRKVRLYVNTTKVAALLKAEKLSKELQKFGYQEVALGEDIVIGFGGDGTLFHFLNENNYNVHSKYIGINCGTLGFLQDFDAEDVQDFVANIPNYVEQKLNFVNLEVECDGIKKSFYALNEFSLHHFKYKSFKAQVLIGKEKLEDFVGTGVIFSTATGSTALGLSAGGAILHPSIQAIQMTPREAIVNKKTHSLPKSICIPKGIEIVLKPLSPIKEERRLSIDSDGEEVFNGIYDSIKITYSNKGITKLKPVQDNFVQTIREKLI